MIATTATAVSGRVRAQRRVACMARDSNCVISVTSITYEYYRQLARPLVFTARAAGGGAGADMAAPAADRRRVPQKLRLRPPVLAGSARRLRVDQNRDRGNRRPGHG